MIRIVLDREGAPGPADVAIAGGADEVGEQIVALGEAGATDFLAIPYGFGRDPKAAAERTRRLLVELAARS